MPLGTGTVPKVLLLLLLPSGCCSPCALFGSYGTFNIGFAVICMAVLSRWGPGFKMNTNSVITPLTAQSAATHRPRTVCQTSSDISLLVTCVSCKGWTAQFAVSGCESPWGPVQSVKPMLSQLFLCLQPATSLWCLARGLPGLGASFFELCVWALYHTAWVTATPIQPTSGHRCWISSSICQTPNYTMRYCTRPNLHTPGFETATLSLHAAYCAMHAQLAVSMKPSC